MINQGLLSCFFVAALGTGIRTAAEVLIQSYITQAQAKVNGKFLLDFWELFCYVRYNEADGTQEGAGLTKRNRN